jgi:hypothetical protein
MFSVLTRISSEIQGRVFLGTHLDSYRYTTLLDDNHSNLHEPNHFTTLHINRCNLLKKNLLQYCKWVLRVHRVCDRILMLEKSALFS